MISDDDVRQLFQNNLHIHRNYLYSEETYPRQLFRGVGPQTWKNYYPGGCERHLFVFKTFNIIPKYCFDCYKVSIEPRTVLELFKLMMVFDEPFLPNDNSRKLMVEVRKQISGAYKGLIYCRGTEEGMEILELTRSQVSRKISKDVPVTLKRGCSEYPLAYPEYSQGTMEYNEQWRKYEELADKEFVFKIPPADFSYNHPTFTTDEVRVMLAWLVYAKTIGDLTYQKIYDGAYGELPTLPNLDRPSHFHPVKDNEAL